MDPLFDYEPSIRKSLLIKLFKKLADPALDVETLKEIAKNEAIPYVWRWQDDLEGHYVKEGTEATTPLRDATGNLVSLLVGIAQRSGLPEVTDCVQPEHAEESEDPSGQLITPPEDIDDLPEMELEETGRLTRGPSVRRFEEFARRLEAEPPGLDSFPPPVRIDELLHGGRAPTHNGQGWARNDRGHSDHEFLRRRFMGQDFMSHESRRNKSMGHESVDDDSKTIEHRFRFLPEDDAEFCEAALSILFHIADGSGGGVYNLFDVVDFPALGRVTCSLLYAVNVNVSMNAVRVLSQVAGAARYFPPLEISRLLLAMSLTIPSTNGSSSRWDGCSSPMEPLFKYLEGKRRFFKGVHNEEWVDEEFLRRMDDPIDFAAKSVGENAPFYIANVRLKRAANDTHQVAMLVAQQMYSLAALMILLSPNGYESVVATRAPDAIHTLLDLCRTHRDGPQVNYAKSCIVEGVTIILSFWTKASDEKVFKRWQLTPILHDLHIPGLDEKYLYQLCDLASFASMRTLLPLMPRLVEMSVDTSLPSEGRLRSLDVLARILMTPEFVEENVVPDKMLESLLVGLQNDVENLRKYQMEWSNEVKLKAKSKSKAKLKAKRYVEIAISHDPERLYQLVTERMEVLSLWIGHLTWTDIDRTLMSTSFVDSLVKITSDPDLLETLPTRALASISATLAKLCETEQARVLLFSEQGLDEKLYLSILALSKTRNRPLDLINVMGTIYKCLWENSDTPDAATPANGSGQTSTGLTKHSEDRMRTATIAVVEVFVVNMKKLLEDYSHRAATQCISGLVTILRIARSGKLDYQTWVSRLLMRYLELGSGMDQSKISLKLPDIVGPLNGTYEEAVSLNKVSGGQLVKYAVTAPNLETAAVVPHFRLEPEILDDLLRSSAELAASRLPMQFMRLLRFVGKNGESKEPSWLTKIIPTPLVFQFLTEAILHAVYNFETAKFKEFCDFSYLSSAIGPSMLLEFTTSLFDSLREISMSPHNASNVLYSHWDGDRKAKVLEVLENLLNACPADNTLYQAVVESAVSLMLVCSIQGDNETLLLATSLFDPLPKMDWWRSKLTALRLRVMTKFGLDAFLTPQLRLLTDSINYLNYFLAEVKRDNLKSSMERHSDGVKAVIEKLPSKLYSEHKSLFLDLLRFASNWDETSSGWEARPDSAIVPDGLAAWSKFSMPGRWLSMIGVLVMRMSSISEIAEDKDYKTVVSGIENDLIDAIASHRTQDPVAFKTLHLIHLIGLKHEFSLNKEASDDSRQLLNEIPEASVPFETQVKFVSACKSAVHHFVEMSGPEGNEGSSVHDAAFEAGLIGLTFFVSAFVQNDVRLASVAVKSGLVQEFIDSIGKVSKDKVRCMAESLMGLCHVIVTSPAVMAGILIEILNGRDHYHRSDLLGRNGRDLSPAEAIIRRKPQLSRIVEASFVKADNGRLVQWHIVEKAAKQAGMKVQTPKYLNASRYASLDKSAMKALISQLANAFLNPSVAHEADVLRDVLRDLIVTTGKTREVLLSKFPRFVEDAVLQYSVHPTQQSPTVNATRGSKLVSQVIGCLTRKSRDEPHSAATLKSLERSTRHVLHSLIKVLDIEVPRRKQRFPDQAIALLHTCCDAIRQIWGDQDLAWHNLAFISENAADDTAPFRVYNHAIVQELSAVEALMKAIALFDFSTQTLEGLRAKFLNFTMQVVKQDAFKVIRGSRYPKGAAHAPRDSLSNEANGEDGDSHSGPAAPVAQNVEEDLDELMEVEISAERRREHQQRIESGHGNVFRNSSLGEYESSSESDIDSLGSDGEDGEMIDEEAISLSEFEGGFSDNESDIEMSSGASYSEHEEDTEFPQLEITLVISADEDENSNNSSEGGDSDEDEESVMEQSALDSYLDGIDMRHSESSSDEERMNDESDSPYEIEFVTEGPEDHEDHEGHEPAPELSSGLQPGAEVFLLYSGRNPEEIEDMEEDGSSAFLESQSYRQLGYFESAFHGETDSKTRSLSFIGIPPLEENSGLIWDSLQLSQPDKITRLAALATKMHAAATETRLHGKIQVIDEVRRYLNDPLAFAQFRFALKTDSDPHFPCLPQLMAMVSRIMFTDIFDNDRFSLHEILSWVALHPIGPHVIMALLNVLLNASRGHIDASYATLSRSATTKSGHPPASPSKLAALPHTALPPATTPALVCSNLLLILSDFFAVSEDTELSFESMFRAGILAVCFGTNLARAKRLPGEENTLLNKVEAIAKHLVTTSGSHLMSLFTVPLVGGFREQQISASELISQVFERAKRGDLSRSTGEGTQNDGSSGTPESLHVKLDGALAQQLVEALGSRQCNSRVFYNITGVITDFMTPDALIMPIVEAIGVTKSDLISSMANVSREQNRVTDHYHTARFFDVISKDQLRLLRLFTLIGEMFTHYKCLAILQRLGLISLWTKVLEFVSIFRQKQTLGHASLMSLLDTVTLPADIVLREYGSASEKEVDENGYADDQGTLREFTNEVKSFLRDQLPSYQGLMNEQLRQNPKLMNGPLGTIARNYNLLDFENKQIWLERQLDEAAEKSRRVNLLFTFSRDNVLERSIKDFTELKTEELRYPMSVRFEGEPGIDEGGLTREWFEILSRELVSPQLGLFIPTVRGSSVYQVNPSLEMNDETNEKFRFVGRILGRSVFDRRAVGLHFSRVIYKHILHQGISLSDMEAVDQEYYKSLMWMLENDITDVFFETFSYDLEQFGTTTTVDLVPNGRNITVNESNKHDYVRLIVEHRLVGSVKPSLDALEQGFYDVLDRSWIQMFSDQELELLISGLPTIDVEDWKRNTKYEGYTASSQQVVWFWLAVKSFSAEQKARLLQFSTGTSRVPARGFGMLASNTGDGRFVVHKEHGSTNRLPSSHTCMNQISLPEYESYKKLRTLLLKAITEGNEGFGFA